MRSHVIARVRLHIRIQATAPIPLLRDRDRSVRGGAAGTLLWPVTLKTILDVSYRNEAGRPPPNLPLVRGRDFHRYRFQCYSRLVPLPARERGGGGSLLSKDSQGPAIQESGAEDSIITRHTH